jgi:tetratricopeptide (TPR) repeat protein
VSDGLQTGDRPIPERVILRIDHAASPERRRAFIERLEPILPHLNWRTHFFIVSESPPGELEFAREIIRALARFLARRPFVSFYVHPVIQIGPSASNDRAGWEELLEETRTFRREAYEQQTEARLAILPILDPAVGTADSDWIRAAQFFLERVAKPCVLLRERDAGQRALGVAGQEIRFYIEPDQLSDGEVLIRQLWVNSVFEDLLERVTGGVGGDDLRLPCRSHSLIDQRSDEVYACFHDWSVGRSLGTLRDISERGAGITEEPGAEACAPCIGRSLRAMTSSLIANERRAEGRQVHFELALAFSASGRHRQAIEHAARARDLAASDADRAGAQIVQGLCHLDLREFEEAERALREAAGGAEDPGLVSFHRGRVQFEWRDYIEALERFEEALASGSEAVPRGDLYYYMAVSHVHIQEYREARPYLERWSEVGEHRATMLYYKGLCDIGEGEFESALAELRGSEKAGPSRREMGNVLFYTGHCLKELNRYREAIPVLKRAAEFDPGEIAVFNLLGFCFFKTGRHEEAVGSFEQAVSLDPRSAIDYANLARNLREIGRVDEAIAMYRKALSLDPNIGFARDQLRQLTNGGG